MKNIKKLLILIIIGIIFNTTSVYAYVESISDASKVIKNNEVNSKKYLLMCSYAHKSEAKSSAHPKGLWQRINIYYAYDNKWVVAWDNTSASAGYTKKGTADKVFGTSGKNVFISDADKNAIVKDGTCPKLGYVDNSAVNGGNEVCFGTKKYCKEQSKKTGAKEFAKGDTSSKKNYDLLETIDDFVKNWKPTDDWEWYQSLWGKSGVSSTIALANIDQDKAAKQCKKFKNEIKDNVGKLVRESIIKNFLNSDETKNIPSFLESKTQKAITTLNDSLKNYSTYVCDAITNNDPSLTEEEKETEKKEQEEARTEIDSDLQEVQTEVNSKIEAKIETNFMDITTNEIGCEGIFAGNFGNALKRVLSLLRFVVPILIIGLSIIDFVKAIAAQDDSEIKKAANKMFKRIIIGVIIFLLPTILELILKLAGVDYGTCGIK